MRLTPCFGCPLRHGCALRDEWRAKVGGLGLRRADFKCPRLTAEIRPGRRVEILHPFFVRSHSYDEPYTRTDKPVRATIQTTDDRHRFSAIVDPGQFTVDDCAAVPRDGPGGQTDEQKIDRYRYRKRMRHARIVRFLDEPDRTPIHERAVTP